MCIQHIEGTWKVCRGCTEGFGIVARCVEGEMEQLLGVQRSHRGSVEGVLRGTEWLLGTWMGNGAVARCVEGAQEVTEGAQRACAVEWNSC